MRRPPVLAALALVLALGTAACGGADTDSDLPKSAATTSASPSPSATPSWSATTKPERPKDEQSDAGAQAFATFAADTVLYMMATGDAPALSEISDLNSCETCRLWADNHADGKINKLMIGTGPPTYALSGAPKVTDEVFYRVDLAMDIPRGTSVRKDGSNRERVKAVKDLPFRADLQWKDEKWLLMRFDMG